MSLKIPSFRASRVASTSLARPFPFIDTFLERCGGILCAFPKFSLSESQRVRSANGYFGYVIILKVAPYIEAVACVIALLFFLPQLDVDYMTSFRSKCLSR